MMSASRFICLTGVKSMKNGNITLDIDEVYEGGLDIKMNDSVSPMKVKAAIARALNKISGITVTQIFNSPCHTHTVSGDE